MSLLGTMWWDCESDRWCGGGMRVDTPTHHHTRTVKLMHHLPPGYSPCGRALSDGSITTSRSACQSAPLLRTALLRTVSHCLSHCSAPHSTARHITTPYRPSAHCTPSHCTAPHRTASHHIASHSTAPHRTELHSTALNHPAPHRTAPHRNNRTAITALQRFALHSTATYCISPSRPDTVLHCTAAYCTTMHHTAPHHLAPLRTILHCTAPHHTVP